MEHNHHRLLVFVIVLGIAAVGGLQYLNQKTSENAIPVTVGDITAAHSRLQELGATFTDVAPPTVRIESPADGAALSGNSAVISITASDAASVSQIRLFVDNNLVSVLTAPPYKKQVDLRNVSQGWHTLTAFAYDASGNSAAASISVNRL